MGCLGRSLEHVGREIPLFALAGLRGGSLEHISGYVLGFRFTASERHRYT